MIAFVLTDGLLVSALIDYSKITKKLVCFCELKEADGWDRLRCETQRGKTSLYEDEFRSY